MKLPKILLCAGLLLVSLLGCERTDFDELLRRQENLQEQLDDHAARLAALENAVKGINADMISLREIVHALQQQISVVSYQATATGYLLTMSDGSSITLNNGRDGKDGQNGSNGQNGTDGKDGKDGVNAPVIGVKQDIDGIYYWTLGGEFIINNGSKIRVHGRDGQDGSHGEDGTDGQDGKTPQLRIDEANNQWLVSYDGGNTWLILRDSAGKPVPATGPSGPQGPQGPTGPEGPSGIPNFTIAADGNGLINITYQGNTYVLLAASVQIAAGSSHTFFISTEGNLFGTGDNAYGQLGIGNRESRNTPVFIMAGVKKVAAGGGISILLKTDGTVWVAGYNFSGELGLGYPRGNAETFTKITDNAKDVFAARSVFVVKNDATLWGTGPNDFGQLALGDIEARSSLTYITDNVISVSQTYAHTLVLKADGKLYGTGANNQHQLGLPLEQTPKTTVRGTHYSDALLLCSDQVKAISTGYQAFSLLLKTDGTVWATGGNRTGQLGTGDLLDRSSWTKVADAVTQIASGSNHSMLLKNDGSLWLSGQNIYGQLANGNNTDLNRFTQVATDVKQIASGSYASNSWIVKKDNSIYASGRNQYGELGNGNTTNVRTLTKITLP